MEDKTTQTITIKFNVEQEEIIKDGLNSIKNRLDEIEGQMSNVNNAKAVYTGESGKKIIVDKKEELEKRIIALEALTTVLINGIAADRHCEWLNETDDRRYYYQVDGKLRYLTDDDWKGYYDRLVNRRTYLIENCQDLEGYQLMLDSINTEINRLCS